MRISETVSGTTLPPETTTATARAPRTSILPARSAPDGCGATRLDGELRTLVQKAEPLARISASLTVTCSTPKSWQTATGSAPAKGAFETVRNRRGSDRDRPPGRERRPERIRQLGLHRDHPYRRGDGLHGDRDPGNQPTTSDGNDDDVDAGNVLADLEPDGSLPGNDERIVERVDDETVAADLLETYRTPPPARLPLRRPRHHSASGGSGLEPARTPPHDHDAVDSFARARIRQRSGMIAGGDTDHAGAPLAGDSGRRAA